MSAESTGRLMAQQQALLGALLTPGGQAAHEASAEAVQPYLNPNAAATARGLLAYRTNGHALAERSLRAAYPVIEMMLGTQSFQALANDLWHRHPPERGDLALWGEALPGFLARSASLADTPYLGDVARCEWALHRAATAPDTPPEPASFARLTQEDPASLSLILAPGTTVIRSDHPVASLILTHRCEPPDLQEAARRLALGQGETAVVWRWGMKPEIAPCQEAAGALLLGLLRGDSLDQALDLALTQASTPTDAFDFSAWLTHAVQTQLVVGVQSASVPPPSEP